MDQETARKLQQIGKIFNLNDPLFSYDEISVSNINYTYRVDYVCDDGTGMAELRPYVIQKMSPYAFPDPDSLMDNVSMVSEHIRSKRLGETNLHFHYTDVTGERKMYFRDEETFWRVYRFIPAITMETSSDETVLRNAGKAFGDFQVFLSDFNVEKLSYTIPDFHNTRKRYNSLIHDFVKDPKGRVSEVRPEIEYLLSVQEKACELTDLGNSGKLPLRVTHNDTKLNNILFDEKTLEPLVVIDFDTVMPGLVGHDFGDAIRFAANPEGEDSDKLENVCIDLNAFWAFADGFLSKTANILTEAEIDMLAPSCFCITCELAVRFLDDYIIGDRYFKIRDEEHNLRRTRCQIALAKDMQEKMWAMQAIVRSCAKKYKNK